MKINLEILNSAYIYSKNDIQDLNTKELVPKMMLRRRLTRASKIAIYLAHQVGIKNERILYGSSFGELPATANILNSICAKEPISPTSFQNSVYNTAASYLSILTNNKNEIITISSGDKTSSNLLKAAAVKSLDGDEIVLIVTETLNIDNINEVNTCIDNLECGVALKVRLTKNKANLNFDNIKNGYKLPLSTLIMFDIAKQFQENNKKNIIEIVL